MHLLFFCGVSFEIDHLINWLREEACFLGVSNADMHILFFEAVCDIDFSKTKFHIIHTNMKYIACNLISS